MKALLAQMSGGVTVNIEPVEPSDLIQQLEDLRWTNEKLLEETPRDGWPNNQVDEYLQDTNITPVLIV